MADTQMTLQSTLAVEELTHKETSTQATRMVGLTKK